MVEDCEQPLVAGNFLKDLAASHQRVDALSGKPFERVASAIRAQVRLQSFTESHELILAEVVLDDGEAVHVEPGQVTIQIEAGRQPAGPRQVLSHSSSPALTLPPYHHGWRRLEISLLTHQ